MNESLPLLPLCLSELSDEFAGILTREGVPHRPHDPARPRGTFVLYDGRFRQPVPELADGQIPLDIGVIASDPGNAHPLDLLEDESAELRRWQVGPLSLVEHVARTDRREVRRWIVGELRKAIEKRGGIWVTLSPFPFPYRSALNVRIDYDQFDRADFHRMLDATEGHENATSHFVCASAYEGQTEAVARLRGMDVGSHGQHHHTYRSFEENRSNIARGIATLQQMGIEPSGFVAPGGRFTPGLRKALDQLNVGHSSEFAWGYDDLPGHPANSSTLQIPVHPVCLGLFLGAVVGEGSRRTAAERQAIRLAGDYFRDLIRTRYRQCEPIFLYGHPTGRLGRFPQMLSQIFEQTSELSGLWPTTMTQMATWWKARSCVRLRVEREGDAYRVTCDALPESWPLAFDYWRGKHVARMPLENRVTRFNPSALAYESREARPTFKPVRIDQPEGLKGRVKRWLDWEKETPIDELPTDSIRNRTKRLLRRIYE